MVYESFESDAVGKTGLVPYPDVHKERFIGGHALVCVGYDDSVNHFIALNSWSDAWGDRGFCYIPYAFIANQ